MRISYFIPLLIILFASCKKKVEPTKSFEQTVSEQSCKTCADFTTQLEAKNYVLNLKPECFDSLASADSVYCPNLPVDGSAIDYSNCKQCKDFANEAEAKAYADTTTHCRFLIDPNFNGAYCEVGEGAFSDGSHGKSACKTCSDFRYLEVVAEYVVGRADCASILTLTNGVYCSNLPSITTIAGTSADACKTCSDFANRQEAAYYLGLRSDCVSSLEVDANGVACPNLPSVLD